MKFVSPGYLFLIVPVLVVFAFCYFVLERRRTVKTNLLVDRGLQAKVLNGFFPRGYGIKGFFLSVALFFSLLALARPQWGYEWQTVRQQGFDVVVAVDVSRSMLSADVPPSRLARVQLEIRDLLSRLRSDRIGLVSFAGTAFLSCPLTSDYSGFRLHLDELSPEQIPRGGTNMEQAIDIGVRALQDTPKGYRHIILITDGENHEGDPLMAARRAAAQGVRIHTVGMGTPSGELIRLVNENGEEEFLKDSSGNVVKSRLNEQLLREIAQLSGGSFLRPAGAAFGLDELFESELARGQRREIDSSRTKKYYDRYYFFLWPAFFMILVELLVPLRRASG